jgi:RNA-binding protein 23/39
VVPSVDELEEKARREAARRQKEIDDLTKDQRTVFVSQLTAKVTDKDIKEFFSQLGPVNNVILIRDKYTGRHKGFCYVEMADLESVPTCLLLNGLPPDFQKFPILVKASEAEKNFLARKDTAQSAPATHASRSVGQSDREVLDSRVYVGNLHVNISEEDLEQVLSQFGRVESVHIHRDEVGTSKGYAFGKFARAEDAARAISKLSGLELAGRSIKVGYVTDGGNSGGGGGGASQAASGNWKLDDDEGTGMQMNAQSRAMLMARLGQNAGIKMPTVPAAAAALMKPAPAPAATATGSTKAPPVGGDPSPCFYIKNMFVLEEETGDDWDLEIQEDVTEECQKHGAVTHCYVEKHKPGGFVYMKFASVQAATLAAQSLNGRWFAGKMITCTFMHPAEYASKFRV